MPDDSPPARRPDLRLALLRAVRLRCPSCGRGKLYQAYLKPVDTCAACGAPLGRVPSEDGPAWLTVLILGPFLVAVTLFVSRAPLPAWISLSGAAAAVIGVVLLALPVVKSGWIGILWSMGKVGESQE